MRNTADTWIYRVGCSAESPDHEIIEGLISLVREGLADHLQVVIIPEHPYEFTRTLEVLGTCDVPVIIHAPYHRHGLNPCAPYAFSDEPRSTINTKIETALQQTAEAADTTSSPYIVLHAGRYPHGGEQAATDDFVSFMESYADPRMILENLPAQFSGVPMLGTSAEELRELGDPFVSGYCLDFAHLYCSSNFHGLDFLQEVLSFEALPVRLHHLSSCSAGSVKDQHLPLDHPDAALPLDPVIRRIRTHPDIPTSLEYKRDSRFYLEQLAFLEKVHANCP
jgi:endonuclease IV